MYTSHGVTPKSTSTTISTRKSAQVQNSRCSSRVQCSSLSASAFAKLNTLRYAVLLSLLIFLYDSPTVVYAQPGRCPYGPLSFVSGSDTRSTVEADYLVIEYNADTHQTFWFDYHHHYNLATPISQNGSFLPVVYTKEKIAVHVCNLHFTDQLTVTNSPSTLPEGGADIRNTAVTSSTLQSLTSTFDILQSGAATGGATPESGLGFSPTAPVTATTVSGVTPGTFTFSFDSTKKPPSSSSYTSDAITASGEQIALMMYALRKNAYALADSIDDMEGHIPPATPKKLPGSIDFLNSEIVRIRQKINNDTASASFVSDSAAFDEDLTAVQGLSAELGILASALSAQAFGSRAVTLNNNYATLRGILDFVELGANPLTCQPDLGKSSTLTLDQIAALTPEQIAALPTAEIPKLTPLQLGMLSASRRIALLQRGTDAKGEVSGENRPMCGTFEQGKFAAFLNSYNATLARLGEPNPQVFSAEVAISRREMFQALDDLKGDLTSIDDDTGNIFKQINDWYQSSAVEQTDLITPATNNALERISIIVQRGYTPFTLTNNPTATVAAATAAAVAPSASTSTPAHAVKTVLVEVHRVANFNLAGGVMLIHVPTANYTVQPSPTLASPSSTSPTGYTGMCNNKPVNAPAPGTTTSMGTTTTNPATYSCIIETQQTSWQVAGMVGVTWYPWGRDYFPRHSGFASYRRNLYPSLLVATSVTSLGNAVGAVNWEPIGGIDIFAGVGSAHRNVLPNGVLTDTAVPTGYTLPTTIGTQLHAGFATGIALDLGIFTQLFSKPSVAALP